MTTQFVTRPDQLEVVGSPLRKMWCTIDNIEQEPNEKYGPSNILYLVFDNPRVDILESVGTYEFETHELKIKDSAKARSTWGILIDSLSKLGIEDIEEL